MKTTIFLASAALMLTSCATIIGGSKQTVKFNSTPENAKIFIDEVEVGNTPFEMKLARKSEHHVMLKLDGYKTYETNLTKKFNEWYLGNIIFGGIIGLVIDPITGALYRLTPEEINAGLEKGTAFKNTKEGIYIAVSMEIDPSWKKIGELEKL